MSKLLPPTASVSGAWLLSLERAAETDDGRAVHVVSTVTEPGTEIGSIRRVLDETLDAAGAQSVDTVAETIFPASLSPDPELAWSPELSAAEGALLDAAAVNLYETYTAVLPMLRTVNANKSGTYFSRMISWPGKEGGGVNQLAARIDRPRGEHAADRRTHNALDMDVAADALADEEGIRGLQVYAATDRRIRSFPCLTHVDLTLHRGRLHATAVYRHQYLIDKAYGNLLGLSWLMQFLCQQSGQELGELVVHATLADTQGRPSALRLARDARAASRIGRARHDRRTPVTAPSPVAALQSAWHASIEFADAATGAGIDLVEVEPLRELVDAGGEGFLDAAWTSREQREANGQAEGLAGKWAAKEAVMKILQRGIGDVDPRDIEIVSDPCGAPRVELHRGALALAKRRRISGWHISLTHEGGWAAAIVIAASLRSSFADTTTVTAQEGSNRG